jgi:two-component system cell cycle sensor histidine kinase/response regulator CckA
MEQQPVRLLIMDENYQNYLTTSNFIHQIPTQKYDTYWCSDYHQAMDSVLNSSYDVYVIDYHLRGKKSTDHLVEAMMEECEEAVVLLTNETRASLNKNLHNLMARNPLIKSELNCEKLASGIHYAIEQSKQSKRTSHVYSKTRKVTLI